MPSHIAAIVILAAVATAQSANCQDGACDAEGQDTITLLQAPNATKGVIKAHGEAKTNGKKPLLHKEKPSTQTPSLKVSAVVAEYVAMTLFVIIGCGSAMGNAEEPSWVLQVALTFGLAISALAYSIGHYSGGQINCAVTFALVLTGHLGLVQGLANFVAQMLGAITGAFILTRIVPEGKDKTNGLGTNAISEGVTKTNVSVGEFMMTFLLVFVVFETAENPQTAATREMAALAIGMAVFLAHTVLIPLDGCSINPTRSFGPALVHRFFYAKAAPAPSAPETSETRVPLELGDDSAPRKVVSSAFRDMWIFWAAPLLGAAGAALVSTLLWQK